MRKLAYVLLSFYASIAVGQTQPEKIDKLMSKFYKNEQFNGVILVADDGKVIYKKAFGVADFEWNVNHTIDTKFEIASITKTFTALLVMKLSESEKINLDAKINDYLKDYPLENGSKITVRQLLTHTSGMPADIADFPSRGNNFPDIAAKINEEFLNLEEQVALIGKRPLLFEPGTGYSYSSDGYSVLGRIIEVICNNSYEQVLDSLIIKPLSLKSTGYKDHYTIIGKRAAGYKETYGDYAKGRQFGIAPSGGMYSTIEDLFAWEQSLYSNKLISQESKKIIFKKSTGITNYGWKVNENFFQAESSDSVKVVKCTGALPGFNSLVVRFLNENKTIILLENVRRITYRHDEIVESIANILYGKPFVYPKKSLAMEMAVRLQRSGIDESMDLYKSYKNNSSDYYFSEREVNSVGYYLLYDTRKVKTAITLFKLNAMEFPKSGNAFDSLGEAYMVLGDKENAIANYSKSLELMPTNENAVETLKKLKQ